MEKIPNEIQGMIEEQKNNNWYPSLNEYDPGITATQYESALRKGFSDKLETLSVLYYIHEMGGAATCTEIAAKYGGTYNKYLNRCNAITTYVARETGCPLQKREDGDSDRLWTVLFYGKNQEPGKPGTFVWKLREPLEEAIVKMASDGMFKTLGADKSPKEEMMTVYDKNMILYGPPGTGKTYNSVNYAVAICDQRDMESVQAESYDQVHARFEQLRKEGRIAFTTFHQSYGYEEFVEGIKPVFEDDGSSLRYRVEDGAFKEFCKKARQFRVESSENVYIKESPKIFGMLLGGTGMNPIKRKCFDNNEIRLSWHEIHDDEITDHENDTVSQKLAKYMIWVIKDEMEIGDIVVIEKSMKSIDAIGVITGEYEFDNSVEEYQRKRSVKWLVKDIDEDMIQYLPQGRQALSRYSLYDFNYIGMDVITSIVDKYTDKPLLQVNQESKPYVFIIDEINRGNISKIFGELITLIEDKKREGAEEAMSVVLPYSKEVFSVPQNVYILGTMNTADRSIALIDTALRRRFSFEEMMPDSSVLIKKQIGTIEIDDETLNVARMLEIMNQRIAYLYDREHTIGHAYFMGLADEPTIETLANIFERRVIPLLQEYFYEDYEKIQLVLGDNTKEDEFKFVVDRTVSVRDAFNGHPDITLPEKEYRIQKEALYNVKSYKQIGEGV